MIGFWEMHVDSHVNKISQVIPLGLKNIEHDALC